VAAPSRGDRARGRAGEIAADQRERRPLREALEREQDRRARAIRDVLQDLEIRLERAEIGDEARRLEAGDIDAARDLFAESCARRHP